MTIARGWAMPCPVLSSRAREERSEVRGEVEAPSPRRSRGGWVPGSRVRVHVCQGVVGVRGWPRVVGCWKIAPDERVVARLHRQGTFAPAPPPPFSGVLQRPGAETSRGWRRLPSRRSRCRRCSSVRRPCRCRRRAWPAGDRQPFEAICGSETLRTMRVVGRFGAELFADHAEDGVAHFGEVAFSLES